MKVTRTDISTRYCDSQGEMQIAVRQRPDTGMWVLTDWTEPVPKTTWEEFKTRDDAEASAKKIAGRIR
jgi:hypothetical protein